MTATATATDYTLVGPRTLQIGDTVRLHRDRAGRLHPISMMRGCIPNADVTVDGTSWATSRGGYSVAVEGVRLHVEGRVMLVTAAR